tara:strand:+ start:1527 stop:1889 length:363 start_codon:yes stop_codon:yes gene_type:complete
MFKSLKKIFFPLENFEDWIQKAYGGQLGRLLNETQNNVEQVLKPILASQVADGVLIKDVSLVSASFTEVSHKLGRKPAGYIVVRKSAAETVFEDAGDYNNRQLFLRLKSSGAVTVNLWIF